MRKLDWLILKEIWGPWLFGVGIFTTLVLAGTYLLRFTEYLSSGVGILTVVKLTVLTLPAIMATTFPMATLLAALLSFGRLSSDSEIVALRAAGASIGRIVLPVGVFSFCVAILTFWFNEQVVPFAASQATILEGDIKKAAANTVYGPTAIATKQDGRVILLASTDLLVGSRTLVNAQITVFDEDMNPVATIYAKRMVYRGENDWKIEGGAQIVAADGTSTKIAGDVWPESIPTPDVSIADIMASGLKNFANFNMSQLRERITALKNVPRPDRKQIANLEYHYYNKTSIPLAAMVFGLLGAPLGIRNHRTGAAAGFWMSVLIIFGYMTLSNFMAVYAQGGILPPYLASFTPLVIGLIFAAVTIHRKN